MVVHLWLPVKRRWTGDTMIGLELHTSDGHRFIITGSNDANTLTVRGLGDADLPTASGTVIVQRRP